MLQVLPPEALLPLLLLTLAALLIVLFFRQHLGRSDVAAEVGVVGLGVMGSQLCLNLAEKMGSAVAGFDRDEDKVAGMRDAAQVRGAALANAALAPELPAGVAFGRGRAGCPSSRRRRFPSSSRA